MRLTAQPCAPSNPHNKHTSNLQFFCVSHTQQNTLRTIVKHCIYILLSSLQSATHGRLQGNLPTKDSHLQAKTRRGGTGQMQEHLLEPKREMEVTQSGSSPQRKNNTHKSKRVFFDGEKLPAHLQTAHLFPLDQGAPPVEQVRHLYLARTHGPYHRGQCQHDYHYNSQRC